MFRKPTRERILQWGSKGRARPLKQVIHQNELDEHIQVLAIAALAKCDYREALPTLIDTLQHPSEDFRLAAVRAIAACEVSLGIEPLVRMLRDESHYIRLASIRALGELEEPAILPHVMPLLEDSWSQVRIATLEVIAQYNTPQVIHALNKAALSDLIPLRKKALEIITSTPRKEFIESLTENLETDQNSQLVRIITSLSTYPVQQLRTHSLLCTRLINCLWCLEVHAECIDLLGKLGEPDWILLVQPEEDKHQHLAFLRNLAACTDPRLSQQTIDRVIKQVWELEDLS